MQYDKEKLISSYIDNIHILDIFSETYRGGRAQPFYRPYSFKDIKEYWKTYISQNKTHNIDFYIHIPFCVKICSYCNYYISEIESKDMVENYVSYLCDYMDYMSDVFTDVKINSLFIGGGTPSVLTPNQLDKLLKKINTSFNFKDGAEKTFEANPASLIEKKIQVLSENKINKVSMGVQTLNEKTLEKANREYQSLKMITRALENLEKYGIQDVNIDLLIGLDEKELDDFMLSLKTFSQLPLTCITAYWLTPTKEYLEKEFEGNLDMFYDNLHLQVENIYNTLQNEIGNFGFQRYSMSKTSNHCWQFHVSEYTKKTGYTDIGSNCLFGIGSSARSYINSEIVYSHLKYIPNDFKETNVDILGMEISTQDEMLLDIAVKIRDIGKFDIEEINSKYKISFKDKYKVELEHLKEIGYVDIRENVLYISKSMKEKYITLLFFFSYDDMYKRVSTFGDPDIKIQAVGTHISIGYNNGLYRAVDFNSINKRNIVILYIINCIIDKICNKDLDIQTSSKKLYYIIDHALKKSNFPYEIAYVNNK